MEKQKKTLIVYRGNNIFDQDVPTIKGALEEIGHDVDVQRFSPETRKEEIGDWMEENIEDLLQYDSIFPDSTSKCFALGSYPSSKMVNGIGFAKYPSVLIGGKGRLNVSLDDVFNYVLFDAIFGDEIKLDAALDPSFGLYDRYETEKKIYGEIFRRLRGSDSVPEEIYLVEKNLGDHLDAPEISEHVEFTQEELEDAKGMQSRTKDTKAAEMYADWFEGFGVPTVHIIKGISDLPNIADKKDVWCVLDRHCNYSSYPHGEGNHYTNKIVTKGYEKVEVPLEIFCHDISRTGIMEKIDYQDVLIDHIKNKINYKEMEKRNTTKMPKLRELLDGD